MANVVIFHFHATAFPLAPLIINLGTVTNIIALPIQVLLRSMFLNIQTCFSVVRVYGGLVAVPRFIRSVQPNIV